MEKNKKYIILELIFGSITALFGIMCSIAFLFYDLSEDFWGYYIYGTLILFMLCGGITGELNFRRKKFS